MNREDLYNKYNSSYAYFLEIYKEIYKEILTNNSSKKLKIDRFFQSLIKQGMNKDDAKQLINYIFLLGTRSLLRDNKSIKIDEIFNKSCSWLYESQKAGLRYNFKQKNSNILKTIFYFFKKDKKIKLPPNENVYSIKINTKIHYLSDSDFIDILENFRCVAKNFCELFNIGSENLQIRVLSANSGCFKIDLGLKLINVEQFNIIKIPDIDIDIVRYIVEFLTNRKLEDYEGKPVICILKDCITGYLTKKIPDDDDKLKYIDLKKTREAKRVIIKTIQKQPNIESVTLDSTKLWASELDLVV